MARRAAVALVAPPPPCAMGRSASRVSGAYGLGRAAELAVVGEGADAVLEPRGLARAFRGRRGHVIPFHGKATCVERVR